MGEKKRKERILQEQLYTVHTNLKLKLLNLVTLKCNNRERNGMALQIYISSKKQYLMLKISLKLRGERYEKLSGQNHCYFLLIKSNSVFS